ncbi:MAG: hypothetical protein ACYCOO_03380 [Chitinophagaceae bacterium]
MKKALKKTGAILVLLAFFFSITPREFLHEFANHKDTVDHFHPEAWVSPVHIHCAFLHMDMAPFIKGSEFHFQSILTVFQDISTSILDSYHFISLFSSSLRGPPFMR